MNKTKKLTQGAMLLAIIGAMMLIDRQLSFFFEIFLFMIYPVIIIIYASMYSLKDGGILSFGLLVLGLLFGSIKAYMYVPLAIIIGMGISIAIKFNLEKNKLLFISMLAYVIGEIAIVLLISPLFGLDLKTQLADFDIIGEQALVKEVLGQLNISFSSLIPIIFIALLILTGIMEGFFTYFLSVVLLKRFKIKDIGNSDISKMKLSPLTSYILIFLSFLNYLLIYRFSFLIEEYPVISEILICVSFIASAVLMYFGYIFMLLYLRLTLGGKSILIMIVLIIILLPMSLYILMFAGFLYGTGPLKNLIDRKMEEMKNETK